jgi:hypothetical protein
MELTLMESLKKVFTFDESDVETHISDLWKGLRPKKLKIVFQDIYKGKLA